MNKKKIINDPVYGFVSIPSGFIFDLIQHPYFQRLRYIKQVSMTHMVYPGALHTRFQHVIGAMHLMQLAIDTLRSKEVAISGEEEEAALVAILLHDIGHGPFSHSLEHTLIEGVSHEVISSMLMDRLNTEFSGRLSLAITIFNDNYPRRFLHQLVSGQLDTDRMDYLNRDSFFTGVSEGVISFDRIIKMLTVANDELVVEAKGIYSVEKFLIARRLMYWQVYLHKTVIAAEQMLIKALKRAKELSNQGEVLFATPALQHFLKNRVNAENFIAEESHLNWFTKLDDTDILSALKCWVDHDDFILSTLCERILKRDLFRTELRSTDFEESEIAWYKEQAKEQLNLTPEQIDYFIYYQVIYNSAYSAEKEPIRIVNNKGQLLEIAEASDLSNLEALSKKVIKYALTYPKELATKDMGVSSKY
ncbi:HD domain-containing protein [Sphingobacterium bovistauri]|uniref:HD domain-containing protein n=1 Tax=Sphingobacterium bovistauri TaxID=2781959 RepID=A0ABS7Z766_9SPHI|nr:HD domain-containing protein [Sphingobacterium bovistauri]MCA5006036.1 HD domain-containing protein [Sphingobacterium bovistauri]